MVYDPQRLPTLDGFGISFLTVIEQVELSKAGVVPSSVRRNRQFYILSAGYRMTPDVHTPKLVPEYHCSTKCLSQLSH